MCRMKQIIIRNKQKAGATKKVLDRLSDLGSLDRCQETAATEGTNKMGRIDDLPIELQLKIISFVRDPLTLHRIEKVCQTWAEIIRFLELHKGLKFRQIKASAVTWFFGEGHHILLLIPSSLLKWYIGKCSTFNKLS